MKYLLTLYGDETRFADMTPEQGAESMKAWDSYTQDAINAGVHLGGEGLQPSATATTVRIEERGDPIVSDGPFAETKEQLGGFYLIEARDLNDAIRVASKMPPARLGCIEVRAIKELSPRGRAGSR